MSNNQKNDLSSLYHKINSSSDPFDDFLGNTNDDNFNNNINIVPINHSKDIEESINQNTNNNQVSLLNNKKITPVSPPENTISTTNNPSILLNNNIDEFHRKNLLVSFIGFKYEKFCTQKINFGALIFGEYYLFYRRMNFIGFLILITRILIFIYYNPIYSFIINIILAFVFNPLYLSSAKGKIRRVERRNPNATYDELRLKLLSLGGTKSSSAILAFFLTIIFSLVTLIIINITGMSLGNFSSFNILVLLGKNPEFKGSLVYDTNINPNSYYEINLPSEISSNTETGNINGSIKTDPNTVNSNCEYKFGVIKDYSNSKDLAEQMTKYYNLKTSPEELQINSITWYHLTYNNENTVNVYITSRNRRVYMYEFIQEKNANSTSCDEYSTKILNSIYYK